MMDNFMENCKTQISLTDLISGCSDVKSDRHTAGILLKLVEEVGEVSTEVNIAYFGAYKEPGKDGIIGECADMIICICDMLHKENVDLEELAIVFENKMRKWKENVDGANNR